MPQNKTTIQFSSDASAALDHLSQDLQTTKSEVLRSALSLYMYVVNNLRGTARALAVVSEERGETKVEKVIAVPGLMFTRPAPVGEKAMRASGS
jgi:predicted transcriptional regulator